MISIMTPRTLITISLSWTQAHFLRTNTCTETTQTKGHQMLWNGSACILHDYHSAYKERIISLYFYYGSNTWIYCLQNPSDQYFNIHNYVQFISSNTRSSSSPKLKCTLSRSSNNQINFFYFNRVVKLWNTLPIISFLTIKKIKIISLGTSFNISLPCTWFVSCPCSDCTSMSSSMNFTIFLCFPGYPQALCVLHQHPSFIISYPCTISTSNEKDF